MTSVSFIVSSIGAVLLIVAVLVVGRHFARKAEARRATEQRHAQADKLLQGK